jgi:MerR family transcriptional regulator/heat shock protein HspR
VSTSPRSPRAFLIGIAAELAGMHPQTLRVYERRGLITPRRTARNTRLYSEADVALLRRIQELSEEGLNLAGVERVMALERTLERAERRAEALEAKLAAQVASARREAEAIRRSLRTGEIVLARRGNAALVRPVPPVCPPQS